MAQFGMDKNLSIDQPRYESFPFNLDLAGEPIQTSASGKCILIGEHAVVYGANAIAIPLSSIRLELWLTRSKNQNQNQFPQFEDSHSSNKLENLVEKAKSILGIPKSIYFHIDIRGHIPLGAGLGSSASLCVALLRALHQWMTINYGSPLQDIHSKKETSIDLERLAQSANELEKIFHGNPSGLDATVVSYQKPVFFKRGQKPQILELSRENFSTEKINPSKLQFLLVDCLNRSATKDMVEKAKPHFIGEKGDQLVRNFDSLCRKSLDCILQENPFELASALEEAGDLLDELGVNCPESDEIRSFARNILCLSSKITGAGGGGMVLLQLDPVRWQRQLDEALNKFGSNRVFNFSL